MSKIPKRVEDRIKDGIKKYSAILTKVKERDINESDTVTIISDMLSDIFGYDKYLEITSEFAIRNTFCDLAIKQNQEVVYLIECKAIGVTLKEDHLRQAVEYSSTKGIDWAILSNGQYWKIYKVTYDKPIKAEEVMELDFINCSPRDSGFVEKVFMLCREAISKSAIEAYLEQSRLVNRYMISAILRTDDVANLIRRTLRSVSDKARVDAETITNMISDEILKREIVDSEELRAAEKKVKRCLKKKEDRKQSSGSCDGEDNDNGPDDTSGATESADAQ